MRQLVNRGIVYNEDGTIEKVDLVENLDIIDIKSTDERVLHDKFISFNGIDRRFRFRTLKFPVHTSNTTVDYIINTILAIDPEFKFNKIYVGAYDYSTDIFIERLEDNYRRRLGLNSWEEIVVSQNFVDKTELFDILTQDEIDLLSKMGYRVLGIDSRVFVEDDRYKDEIVANFI